ncbi:MAG: methyltransferase domain-containing protein [Gemmatimonadaceae bacterium]
MERGLLRSERLTPGAHSQRKTTYELTGCTICGGITSAQIATREDLDEEMVRLWTFHSRRLRHPVPPKYLTDRLVFSQSPALRLMQCADCSHLYRSPRENAASVVRAYADAPLSESVYESLFENQCRSYAAQAGRLRRCSKHVESGLEVGSYMGGFLAAAAAEGMSFTGIDVNDSTVSFGARRGLRITTGSLEEVSASAEYDAIAIWNTFEQLPDVRSAARICRRLLRDGGVLAVRVPNAGFYSRWRRHLVGALAGIAERVLAHNNLLGFPYREGFTERSMSRLLDDAGFTIRRVYGDTLVPVADQWTKPIAAADERLTKTLQRIFQRGWGAPWVETYAVAR